MFAHVKYRNMFRLPNRDLLDGKVHCSLWTPYSKKYVRGKLCISTNYICFVSRVLRRLHSFALLLFLEVIVDFEHTFMSTLKVFKLVELIIPIRDIYIVEKPSYNSKITSNAAASSSRDDSSAGDDEYDLQHSLVISTKTKVSISF